MPPKVNKIEAEIKKLSKADGNKTCADCPEKVPGYVDLTHNVFICTKCSGIHREFQFKVKGVSMSVFTEDDVQGLARMGNEQFNSQYLARLSARDYSVPNGNDINKLKDFIRQKYIDKKWHRDLGSVGVSSASSPSPASSFDGGGAGTVANPPSNRLSINLNKTSSFSAASRRASTGSFETNKKPPSSNSDISMDLLNMSITDNTKPSSDSSAGFDPFSSPVPAQSSGGFDPFGEQGKTNHDSFSSGSGFDALNSPPPKQNVPQNGGFDAFGFNAPGQGAAQSGGGFANFDAAHTPQSNGFAAFNSNSSASYSQPQANPAPMPFIKTSPPPAPAPAAAPNPSTTALTGVPTTTTKNFSAFDDLITITPAPAQPTANSAAPHTSNPFDMNAHPSPQAYAPHPYGAMPPHQSGYPPQAYPGMPHGSAPYPPNPYGYPPNMPPGPPAGYYPNQGPAPHNPYYPAPAHMGYPPQSAAHPQAPVNVPAVAPAPVTAAPDPFAAMSSIAWSAVGSSNPSSSAPFSTITSHPPQQSSAPVQPSSIASSSNASASVNPFDLF